MINISEEKCIKCGFCVKDCVANDIVLENDKKAKPNNINCIKCGHCIAICPTNAISIDEYQMEDVKEYEKETFDIEPEHLLNFIQYRRSIRQFKNQQIEKDKLIKVIEAGRYTATGSNQQKTSFIVVQKEVAKLRNLTLKGLSEMTQAAAKQQPSNGAMQAFAQKWTKMYHADNEQAGKGDSLFYNASSIILIVAESPIDAALAASNMELMAVAQGLGVFYCGFFVRAAHGNSEIKDLVGLKQNQEIQVSLVLGYPDVTYQRTVPRKQAEIKWR